MMVAGRSAFCRLKIVSAAAVSVAAVAAFLVADTDNFAVSALIRSSSACNSASLAACSMSMSSVAAVFAVLFVLVAIVTILYPLRWLSADSATAVPIACIIEQAIKIIVTVDTVNSFVFGGFSVAR
jgi:hypothetical protein